MRKYILYVRLPGGGRGEIVQPAESLLKAIRLAGNPPVIGSRSEPLQERKP